MLEMKDNRRNLINNLSISNLELDKRRPQKARKKNDDDSPYGVAHERQCQRKGGRGLVNIEGYFDSIVKA